MTTTRLERALAAIDAANAEDPNQIEDSEGVSRPKEVVHAEVVTAWLERLSPNPSDEQRLAARAHHLRRWEVPRSSYPDGRAGYLRWRRDRKQAHAEQVAEILAEVGYDEGVIERVAGIVRKDDLGSNPWVQTHEDALCCAFFELQSGPVVAELGHAKAVDVVAKSMRKMSPAGIEAVAGMELSAEVRAVVDEAAGLA